MDFGTELKGCVCRINNCAIELFSMEEDLEIEDEDSWDLVGRDLRLKATFMYIDLSRVISSCESDERKKTLTGLANKFFYFMDEFTDASASQVNLICNCVLIRGRLFKVLPAIQLNIF
uniref:Uncharacterized protein n=1 Tax=Aegilops tauschii subsp. strangulata TaxID=200361 RepID=A0A453CH47_AEGTS